MSEVSKIRKFTFIALLSAISFVLSYFKFPLIPAAQFLTVDFTLLPVLIGLFSFGLGTAYSILAVRSILWLLFNQDASTLIGLPMNFVVIAVFMSVLWLFLRKKFTFKAYIFAAILGSIAMAAVMLLLNTIYAIPLYSIFANFNIASMFPGGIKAYLIIVIIFNLLEGLLYSISFALLYWTLRKSRAIPFVNQ